jgi:hypothetical protein
MCDVPSIAVFGSESIECFPGTVSKFFFKLIIIIIIIAFDFSLCGSIPYTNTDKTNKNKYT